MDTRPRDIRHAALALACTIPCLGWASGAQAHIDVDRAGSHMSRYGASSIKQGPCGVTGGQRGTNVYTYMPGDTVMLTVNEYIGHPGYFRISFDDDGDDGFMNPQTIDPINRACMPDPADKCGAADFFNNPTVLMDNLDPHDYPPVGSTPSYTWAIELPDVECENCTLQILQVMTDPPGIHAPYDPSYTSDDLYYQCIDLVLRRGTPAGGVDPNGQMMNPDPTDPSVDPNMPMSGTAGSGVSGTGGSAGGAGGIGGGAGTGGTASQGYNDSSGGVPTTTSGSSSSGCTVSPRVGATHPAVLLLLCAGLLMYRRRHHA